MMNALQVTRMERFADELLGPKRLPNPKDPWA
jgi:hypothetical protein